MKLHTFGILLISGILSSECMAAASDLSISGNVVASPCVIDVDSANQTIDFGQSRSGDFVTAGQGGEWKPFSIMLTECPLTTRHVMVSLTGTSNPDDDTLYINTGSAPHVGIQIAEGQTQQILRPGSQVTVAVDSISKKVTIPLVSRLYSTGQISAGSVRGALQLNFTYQ
ncbi:fimbrial protein [Yersinia sp. 1652 StPb PI]|uniref:fimbrial protein n=1 Tax=unclassified Yersinia (in: enterobacteria) TaxID=2653513 RepID=UPI00355B7506